MYRYKVSNLRIIDGDTVECDIDLGFDVWLLKQRIRLYGIDAPETRTRDLDEKAKGLDTKHWLSARLLSVDINNLLLGTDEFKPRGKFGRILGTFYIRMDEYWIDVNREMVELGLAKDYHGGKRK